ERLDGSPSALSLRAAEKFLVAQRHFLDVFRPKHSGFLRGFHFLVQYLCSHGIFLRIDLLAITDLRCDHSVYHRIWDSAGLCLYVWESGDAISFTELYR